MHALKVRGRRPHLRLVAVVGLAGTLGPAVLVGGARSASEASGLIAFARLDGVYVMRADGSGARPLWRGSWAPSAWPTDVAWSGDGRRLAFATSGAIRVMNAD